MSWEVRYKPTFLKELSRLPPEIRAKVEEFVFQILPQTSNPYAEKGVKKLTGFREYYKVRFGDYRLGLRIDKQAKTVKCCRILHRKDLYRYFP